MTDCLFCRIAAGEIPVKAVHEDDVCVVFPDINPQAPTHWLVIPREHYPYAEAVPPALLGHLLKTAATLAHAACPGGYRVVTNTGGDAGQSVQHVHLHVLGGRVLGWPPG